MNPQKSAQQVAPKPHLVAQADGNVSGRNLGMHGVLVDHLGGWRCGAPSLWRQQHLRSSKRKASVTETSKVLRFGKYYYEESADEVAAACHLLRRIDREH